MSEVESLSLGGLGIIICIFVHVLPFLCACCSWTTVNDLQQQLSPCSTELSLSHLTAHSHQCLLNSALIWDNQRLARVFYSKHKQKSQSAKFQVSLHLQLQPLISQITHTLRVLLQGN